MDNFFRNWVKRRETTDEPRNGIAGNGGDAQTTQTGRSFEDNVVRILSNRAALNVAAWYRGVDLRARTMSQIVWEFQQWNNTGGYFKTDHSISGNKLNYLLQLRPNPLMSASDFQKMMEISKIQDGNAVAFVQRDLTGEPVAIWFCTHASYDLVRNKYIVQYNDIGGLKSIEADAKDVIHIRNTFSDDGGLTGIPTWVYAAKVLGLSATLQQYELDSAAKGGKMKLLVQEERAKQGGVMAQGRVNPLQLKKITQQLNEDLYKQDVVNLSNVAGVTPISMNAQQMQLFESRSFGIPEIARFLSVPKALLMDDSNASYKSPEAATQEFSLRTIQPNTIEMEQEYNAKLLLPGDFGKRRIEGLDKNLRRMDAKGQAEINEVRLRTGVRTVNEIRSEENMPKVKGGDISLVSTNLAPVDSEKLRGGGDGSGETAAYGEEANEGRKTKDEGQTRGEGLATKSRGTVTEERWQKAEGQAAHQEGGEA